MKKWIALSIIIFLLSISLIGCSSETSKASQLKEMSVTELLEKYETTGLDLEEVTYIDVREDDEFSERHIEGFEGIPKSIFECFIDDLSKEKEIVLICNTQNRSRAVGELLVEEYDFDPSKITIVVGGVSSWEGPVISN